MSYESPAYHVIAVPIEKIKPNTYNPNAVAPVELKLLYDSIKEDGYTMPVVCYYDQKRDTYILVDGFHRYRIMLDYPDIYAGVTAEDVEQFIRENVKEELAFVSVIRPKREKEEKSCC